MKETNTKAHKIETVAAKLEISRRGVYRLIEAGEITRIKVGKRLVRVTDESLVNFIARQKTT